MLKRFAPHPLLLCVLFAFICLSIRVGRTDLGGIVDTVVVRADTPDASISNLIITFRVVGIMWLGLAALCIKSTVEWFKDR